MLRITCSSIARGSNFAYWKGGRILVERGISLSILALGLTATCTRLGLVGKFGKQKTQLQLLTNFGLFEGSR